MRIIFLAILSVAILGLVKSSWAATYYVDYQGGNDSNNGTLQSTAWKHAPGDACCATGCTGNSCVTRLAAGDKVIFKKGVTYAGQITMTDSGAQLLGGIISDAAVTSSGVVSFGSSHDLSDVVTALAAGYDVWLNIYNSSNTGAWVESCGLWKVATADNTAKTITLSGFNGVAHSTYEMTVEVSKPITYTTKSNWGIGKATFDGSNHQYSIGSSGPMHYIVINGLDFHNGSAVYVYGDSDNSTLIGIYILNNSITLDVPWTTNQPSAIVVYANGYRNVAIGNTVNGDFFWGVLLGGVSNLTDCNYVTMMRRGIGASGDYVISRYNTIYDYTYNGVGAHPDAFYVDHGSYGWIYGNYVYHSIEGFSNYAASSSVYPDHFTYHSNIAISTYSGDGVGQTAFPNQGISTRYYNNLIYNWQFATGGTDLAPFANADWKNNVVLNTNMSSCALCTGLVADYNYYNNTGFRWNCTSETCDEPNWGAWQGLVGDSHSTNSAVANSTIVNTDWTKPASAGLPEASSPLIGRGTNSLTSIFTLDKNKVVRGSSWDIGAYEYVSGDTTAPAAPRGLSVQ